MRSLSSQLTCIYMVLTTLFGALGGSGGAVLCLGTDGHVILEPGDQRCIDRLPAAGATQLERSEESGCGSCYDVPLGSHDLRNARPRTSNQPHSFDTGSLTPGRLHVPVAALPPGQAAIRGPQPARLLTQDIVLRN